MKGRSQILLQKNRYEMDSEIVRLIKQEEAEGYQVHWFSQTSFTQEYVLQKLLQQTKSPNRTKTG